jgi:hypothetical protein
LKIEEISRLLAAMPHRKVFDANDILFGAIQKGFSVLGENSSAALLSHLVVTRQLPDDLVTDYASAEKAIASVSGYGSKIILKAIKQALAEQTPSRNSRQSVQEMVQEIEAAKISDFVRHMPARSHVAFFYSRASHRDRVLSDHLASGKAPKWLMSVDHPRMPFNYNSTYAELVFRNRGDWVKRTFDYIERLHAANETSEPTRVGGEDASWFFRNGEGTAIVQTEQEIGPQIQKNMTFLCCYGAEAMDDEQAVKAILASHSHVIIDNPLALYQIMDSS